MSWTALGKFAQNGAVVLEPTYLLRSARNPEPPNWLTKVVGSCRTSGACDRERKRSAALFISSMSVPPTPTRLSLTLGYFAFHSFAMLPHHFFARSTELNT